MPTGLVVTLPTLFGCTITAGLSPRRKGSVGSALLSTRMTVCGSAIEMVEMFSNTDFLALFVLFGALARSKLNFTALASKSAPSENFTPFFRRKV